MDALATLLVGYSVFGALALGAVHLRGEAFREQRLAQGAGAVLLAVLAGLQAAHGAALQFGAQAFDARWIAGPVYRSALFLVAPAFFLFTRPVLQPGREAPRAGRLALHGLPALLAGLLPTTVALPLAFVIGAGYLAVLARELFGLRNERANFRAELALLGLAFGLALGATALGIAAEALPGRLFVGLYASAIGLALLLVQVALGLRPQLPVEVRESVQAGYATTTLARVDCDAALQRLEALLQGERLYADPQLSLGRLATRLGLSPHQLSELVNTRLGKGFSRHLRECRIEAAKAMLVAEPRASVLSVGLSVGFTSQSNFYEAFREIEGGTPGQYRKRLLGPGLAPN